MKFQPNPDNGKLDLVVQYDAAFQEADIYPNELQGMKDRAAHYRVSGTKAEKQLARDLSRAVLWIEREVYVKQRTSAAQEQEGV